MGSDNCGSVGPAAVGAADSGFALSHCDAELFAVACSQTFVTERCNPYFAWGCFDLCVIRRLGQLE